MTHVSTAGPQLVAVLEMHLHVIWPRFITSMVILGSILGALVYLQVRK